MIDPVVAEAFKEEPIVVDLRKDGRRHHAVVYDGLGVYLDRKFWRRESALNKVAKVLEEVMAHRNSLPVGTRSPTPTASLEES